MKFFSRRGRGRSGKGKRHDQDEEMRKKEEDSVGSDLPTVDQFEIAVPSKSFNSVGVDDRRFPVEAREDQEMDERSNTDVSSITSVSYRAGYYYLRNVKRNKPEKKSAKNSSCCVAPSCSCSWLTCCCCAEAESELATDPTSQNSLVLQKPRKAHPSPSERRALLLAQQQGIYQPYMNERGPVHPGFVPPPNENNVHRTTHKNFHRQSRRYPMRDPITRKMDRPPMYEEQMPTQPALKQSHSLFDELSEDEEIHGYGRRRMMIPEKHMIMPMKHKARDKSSSKVWRMTRGREPISNGRERPRSTSRGKGGRRFDRYQMY